MQACNNKVDAARDGGVGGGGNGVHTTGDGDKSNVDANRDSSEEESIDEGCG